MMFDWQVVQMLKEWALLEKDVTTNCSMRYEPQMYERSKKRNTDFV